MRRGQSSFPPCCGASVLSHHVAGPEFISAMQQGQSLFPPCRGARVRSHHVAGPEFISIMQQGQSSFPPCSRVRFVPIMRFMRISFPSPCRSAELQIQATASDLKKKVCVLRIKLKSSGLQGKCFLSSEPSHWLFIFFRAVGLLIAQASLELNTPLSQPPKC